jgi:excisionase family DNA binding protein
MSQYRTGAPSQPRTSRPSGVPGGVYMISAVILGVFILIAGVNVGSGLKKLTAAVEEKQFSDEYNSPDNLTVNAAAEKKYLTQSEAAAYLNVSVDDITKAIADKEIKEYIITSDGYSISIESLDDYFAQEAYEIQMKMNSSDE